MRKILTISGAGSWLDRNEKRNAYRLVDGYVLAWLLFELYLFTFSVINPDYITASWFVWLVRILVSYRLFDIFQAWVNQFVLMPDWQPVDPYRALVLVFIGYIEVIFSYALIALVFPHSFSGIFETGWQALYHSVTTAITIGSNSQPTIPSGYAIFCTQIMFSLLFVTAVIQRILGDIAARRNK